MVSYFLRKDTGRKSLLRSIARGVEKNFFYLALNEKQGARASNGADAKLRGETLRRFISGWRKPWWEHLWGVVLACSRVSESIVWQ
jgi:hypothetical protein